jgi:hypothetical protein
VNDHPIAKKILERLALYQRAGHLDRLKVYSYSIDHQTGEMRIEVSLTPIPARAETDAERIARLEKEVAGLKARIEKKIDDDDRKERDESLRRRIGAPY